MKFITIIFFCIIIISACGKKQTSSTVIIPIDESDTSTWVTANPDFYKEKLSKGINLSNWFNDYSDMNQYTNRFSNINFKQLKDLGFKHVRLPIAWELLYNISDPSTLNPQNITFIDDALKKITASGLSVILDAIHGGKENVETSLATDESYSINIMAYWKAIVKRYRYQYSPEQLFFEILNEPHVNPNNINSDIWWPPVQEKLAKAIRSVSKNHFIIVGGGVYNSIYGLKKIKPYAITNLVYNFHFYDKLEFTHQGATWVGSLIAKLSGIPYPSSPEIVKPVIDSSNDPEEKTFLLNYGQEKWNINKIDSIIKEAADWASQNSIAYITCNEFGSYKLVSPRQSRLNWVNDTRTVLEKYKIGWSMWEYDEGFGLVDYNNGLRNNPIVDIQLIKSLGL